MVIEPERGTAPEAKRWNVGEGSGNPDVVVVGAGLAGLAITILLRKAGLTVLCVEPERFPHARVGESLDWSAPGLL